MAHIISAVYGNHLGEPPIFCLVFDYLGGLESIIFTPSVALAVRLLRDLLDDDVGHGEDDKLSQVTTWFERKLSIHTLPVGPPFPPRATNYPAPGPMELFVMTLVAMA